MIKKSYLEDLPDEILIEVCLYLSKFHILYSFGRLNRRLQCTISEFRSQCDFSFFSYDEFQRCYSPSFLNFVCERLTKLSLTNECAPGQIKLFEQIIGDECFETKLPLLKSLTLADFTNDNVTILSKILYLQELDIEFDSHEKLTKQNGNLINFYIFGTSNHFQKVTLYSDQGFKIQPQSQPNTQLEELTIQVDTLEDLLVLFTVAPCLIRLEVDIVRNNSSLISIPEDQMVKHLKELYLHTRDKVIIPFTSMLKPMICSIPSIEYLSIGLRSNDPDYADAILWNDLFISIPNIKTFILGLEIDITTNLIIHLNVDTIEELKQAVFNSFCENFPSFPISIYTNMQTLFIDSVPYRFSRDQSYSTSPEAVRALNTDRTITHQSPRRIIGLSLTGEHVPITINDYLSVISRFPCIKWLYLNSINILDETQEEDSSSRICLRLKYLKSLVYMRSTLCKVNQTFFDKLFYGHEHLDSLKIMYGDLVYLLRTASPSINGIHIKHLVLFSSGADGIIRLSHLNYFISTFPCLEHLTIEVSSSKLVKKNQAEIINALIISFKQLRSFRLVSRRGYLQFVCSLMENEQTKIEWLTHINALGSHLILQPKYLALWKSDCHMTYF